MCRRRSDGTPTRGHTLGFSFAAGVNLYATVAILGVASRYGWAELPTQFEVFDNNIIIGTALALYVVEFFADKIPWVDSAWDTVHTLVRPLGGALIAVATLGEAPATVEGLVALLGGSVAAGAHLAKAGARVVVNTSPEPVSNWIISLAEDVFVAGLGILTLTYPVTAFAVTATLFLLIVIFLGVITQAAWRRLFPTRPHVVSAVTS